MKKFIHTLTILGMLGWTGLFGSWFLSYMETSGHLASSGNQYENLGGTLGLMMGTGFLGFVWFIGFVAMGIVALITKTSKSDKLAEQIKLMNQANLKQSIPPTPQPLHPEPPTQSTTTNPIGLSQLRS